MPSAGPDSATTSDDSTIVALQISGSLGGEVTAGRFDLSMPAGVFKGDAMVSIRVDQGNALKCELNISPASANRFEKPVLLTVNCSGALHVERLGIVWLDEATGTWEEVAGGTNDPKAGTVSAPLQHFSTYAVMEVVREGKAGW